MAFELIGADGMTPQLKQTYDRILLSVAVVDQVFVAHGVKKPLPARGGKSIEFRRLERITITAGSYTLIEGSTNTEVQATYTAVAGTISQFGQFSILSDILQTQSFDPVIEDFVRMFGEGMGEGLDIVVRNDLSSATTIQYADNAHQVGTSGTGSVGSGNYLDAAELLEAKRTLRRNGARPVGMRYMCFVHPDNTKDIMEDPDISDAFKDAAPRGPTNPLFTGEIGDWMGIRFIETNNLRLRTSYGMSGADVYEVLVFGNEFYAVTELDAMAARTVIKDRASGGTSDPLEQRSTVGWKAAMATTILNNDFGVLINVASSRSNAA